MSKRSKRRGAGDGIASGSVLQCWGTCGMGARDKQATAGWGMRRQANSNNVPRSWVEKDGRGWTIDQGAEQTSMVDEELGFLLVGEEGARRGWRGRGLCVRGGGEEGVEVNGIAGWSRVSRGRKREGVRVGMKRKRWERRRKRGLGEG